MKVASTCIVAFLSITAYALSPIASSRRSSTRSVQLLRAMSSNDIEKAAVTMIGRRQAASAMLFGMTGLAFGSAASNANAAARAEYLTEPTDEFKGK